MFLEGGSRGGSTKSRRASLDALYHGDQLLAACQNLLFLRVLHVLYVPQNPMDVAPTGLNRNTICPADLEVTDGENVALADVQQPIENVIIVFCVDDNLVCAIEYGRCFVIDKATSSQEAGIRRTCSGSIRAVD